LRERKRDEFILRSKLVSVVTRINKCGSVQGREEAKQAAAALNAENLKFDVAYTSVLRRAHDSLDIILREIRQPGLPVVKAWELNERHYGALTGYNKAEMAEKYGKEQASTIMELSKR
jgi:bisphosphoglycerate-dependent phosphoglycerate mutase family 1